MSIVSFLNLSIAEITFRILRGILNNFMSMRYMVAIENRRR